MGTRVPNKPVQESGGRVIPVSARARSRCQGNGLLDALPLWVNLVLIVVSAILLALAAKVVVDSAVALAQRLGVSELVVGLTVVAMGTSAPELGVTLVAAYQGQNEISVGNIVGSNIFNIGFILGGAALIRAIPAAKELVWRDAGMLVGSSILLVLLVGLDLTLSHLDGIILLTVLMGYLWVIFLQRKGVAPIPDDVEELAPPTAHPVRETVRLVLGLASIGMASHLLILSATAVARDMGISEWVIAVTVVAAGTSLPELATTLAGFIRGHLSVGVGNVLGSDIFNLLGVLGVAGLMENMQVQPQAQGSLIALAAMTVMTLVFLRTGWQLTRREGLILVLVGAFRWGLDFLPHFLG